MRETTSWPQKGEPGRRPSEPGRRPSIGEGLIVTLGTTDSAETAAGPIRMLPAWRWLLEDECDAR